MGLCGEKEEVGELWVNWGAYGSTGEGMSELGRVWEHLV